MAGVAALSTRTAPRWRAAIIGGQAGPDGKPTATREYRLGCVADDDMLIVSMLDDVSDVKITFEADNFDHAFARAVDISTDMAELADHLSQGVLVSLVECESLADIGIDAG
jgi:hypothetical protein